MKPHYTLAQLRNAFWENHKQFLRVRGYTQNQYAANIRIAWGFFVDDMLKGGYITGKTAQSAIL